MRSMCVGWIRPSRVVRGPKKKAKNHHLVILGMLDIQLEMSFWASILAAENDRCSRHCHVLTVVRFIWNSCPPTRRDLIGQDPASVSGWSCKRQWVELQASVGGAGWSLAMGVPNLGEFSALLQEDAIFRDYFNLFLNLPVSVHGKPH